VRKVGAVLEVVVDEKKEVEMVMNKMETVNSGEDSEEPARVRKATFSVGDDGDEMVMAEHVSA